MRLQNVRSFNLGRRCDQTICITLISLQFCSLAEINSLTNLHSSTNDIQQMSLSPCVSTTARLNSTKLEDLKTALKSHLGKLEKRRLGSKEVSVTWDCGQLGCILAQVTSTALEVGATDFFKTVILTDFVNLISLDHI
eukprot:Gb_26950 [translate_table: standard]